MLLSFALLAVYLIARNWHDTIVSKRLEAAGVQVSGVLVSAEVHSGSRRGRGSSSSGSSATVTYRFDFAGRHFVETEEDVETFAVRPTDHSHPIRVVVLPSDPDVHRIAHGHRPHTWEGTIVGSVFCLLFLLMFGTAGVCCFFPPAPKPVPDPPAAEFFVRPEPFFEVPAPRRVRWRRSNVVWTALFTLVILAPPAYAAAQWRTYLAHRHPSESFWPWNGSAMLECVCEGISYFALALPMYFVRLARIRRCVRLARYGRTTTGVVDWKLRVAWDKAKRKRATIRINGTTIGELPGKEDWVTYRYVVDGLPLFGESADGRAVLWRSHAIPPAVYLPTGREITVVYDPRNPADSVLLPYLRYYLDLDLGESSVEMTCSDAGG